MFKQLKPKMLVPALALAGLLAAAGVAVAAEHGHGGHEGHAAGGAKLTLDNGKKWKTDPSLRSGMTVIRDELGASLDAIHAGTFTPAQYEALAVKIEKEVGGIMASCKLPPAADAQLHLVIGELFAGASTMKGKGGERQGGAVQIFGALGSYAKYFDHPDWKPLSH